MQDDAAAKRSLSVWFVGIFFRRNNQGIILESPRNAVFVSKRRIIGEEEFVLLYESIQAE